MDELIRCERGLVGSAILDASVIDHQETQIGAYEFVDQTSRIVWRVLCRMRAKGQPCANLNAIFPEVKKFDVSAAELAKLAQEDAMPPHVSYCVRIIREEHGRRVLRKAFADGISEIERGGDPEKIREMVASRSSFIPASTEGVSVSQAMREIANRSVNRVAVKQIITGVPMLDYTLSGGMRAGSMIVLAARPSVGKSALAAQIAVDVSKGNQRVLFVSLEMPSADIVSRVLSYETGVRFSEIMGGTMAPDGIDRCLRTADQYESIPLELVDQRNLSVDRLVSLVRSKATTQKLDLVVVDYLGLLQGDRRKPRWEAITEISHSLKTLALAESIPVLCLSQLNRESEGEKPKLSHLRDSGSVEQDADVVMLMHRERGKPRTELIVAKNRNGNVGSVMLEFQKEELRFTQSFNQNPEEDETQPISPPTSVNDFSSYTQRTSIF